MADEGDFKLQRKKVDRKKSIYLEHVDHPLYSFPPKYESGSNNKVDLAWLSKMLSTMSSPVVDVVRLRALAAEKPQKSGSKKKEEIVRAHKIEQEEKHAVADVARLCKEDNPQNVPVNSCTGKLAQKLCLICHFFNADDKAQALDIWLDLGYSKTELVKLVNSDDDHVDAADGSGFIIPEQLGEVYEKCQTVLKAFLKWLASVQDLHSFQMAEMGDRLVPLNFNLFKRHKLDAWQTRAMNALEAKESVLVCAPTSSGKTIISTYMLQSTADDSTVLMVVPSSALAIQVGSMFRQAMDAVIWIACEQFEVITPEVGRPRVIVGTPDELETLLVVGLGDICLRSSIRSLKVAGVVVDEIHNLNNYGSMERLVHYFPQACILGLSATVGNAEHLHAWMQTLRPGQTVHLEKVTQRFFNHQQHFFDGSGIKALSPLATITPETLASAAQGDVPFTPREVLRLHRAMDEQLDDAVMAPMSPSSFFPDKLKRDALNRLSLGQVREYSRALLDVLCKASAEDKAEVLGTFQLKDIPEQVHFPTLVKQLMNSAAASSSSGTGKLPALAFNLDPARCRSAFFELLNQLEAEDAAANPGRARRLERERKRYERLLRKWQAAYDRLNSEEQRADYERDNPKPEPPEDSDSLDETFVVGIPRIGRDELADFWQTLRDSTAYWEKYERVMKPFLVPFVQGLRRGIGLYTKMMPVFYLRFVQKMAQQGMLGLVISDDSLAHGVNMPFRSVVFFGDHPHLTPMLAQQMSGRAGRRGLDRAGHVVYAGLSGARVRELMSGSLPNIVGTDIANVAVCALPVTTKDTISRESSLMSMFFKPLHTFTKRDPEATAAHEAACRKRIVALRGSLEKVPLEFRVLLFSLRNHPHAVDACGALIPAVLKYIMEATVPPPSNKVKRGDPEPKGRRFLRGHEEGLVNLVAVMHAFLEAETLAGGAEGEAGAAPRITWAQSMLAEAIANAARLAAAPDAAGGSVGGSVGHGELVGGRSFFYFSYINNNMTFACGQGGDAAAAAAAAASGALVSSLSISDDVDTSTASSPPPSSTSTVDDIQGAEGAAAAAAKGEEKEKKKVTWGGEEDQAKKGGEGEGQQEGQQEEEEEGEEEEEEFDDEYMAEGGAAVEGASKSRVVGPAFPEGDLDQAKLCAVKERMWRLSSLLLTMRNEFARMCHADSMAKKDKEKRDKGQLNTPAEVMEVMLRMIWRRTFFILVEAPF